ncbi:hypothetical protein AB0L80_02540 [Streptomyces sp. NPDC052069]|uniref:zinc finger domain-containing protein n=1 Tax=Streptomyces sp. NPDC052069 TaxID=3154650 RepID=UPI00343D1394
MTPADAAELLTLAAAFDRRTVGESDARAWAAALNAMPLDADAREAVARHYADTDAWLTPAHVRQQRAKIRAARISTANVYYDGVAGETGAESIARRRALLAAIADGRIGPQSTTQALGLAPGNGAPRELTGGPAPEVADRIAAVGSRIPDEAAELLAPTRRIRAERESLARHGLPDPLDVPCPWEPCRANTGDPCTDRHKRQFAPHPSRLELATARRHAQEMAA